MPRVHLAHRTSGRIRLRIPEKRKDLPYFLSLYEDLRQIPDIGEVTVNPVTGSVLLQFLPESAGYVFGSLYGMGLLSLDTEKQSGPGLLQRAERFFSGHRSRAAEIRIVLLGILIALAVHQLRRGLFLVPALSLLWPAYDLWTPGNKDRGLVRAVTKTASTPAGA